MHHNAADAASALVSSSSPSTLAFIDRALSSVQGRASERAADDGWMRMRSASRKPRSNNAVRAQLRFHEGSPKLSERASGEGGREGNGNDHSRGRQGERAATQRRWRSVDRPSAHLERGGAVAEGRKEGMSSR